MSSIIKVSNIQWTRRNTYDSSGTAITRNRVLTNTNQYDVIYRASNMIEINLIDYSSKTETEVEISFDQPIPGKNLIEGYQISGYKIKLDPNLYEKSYFYDTLKTINDMQWQAPMFLMLAICFLLFGSYGSNWKFLELCQKIYIFYFIRIAYYSDIQELAKFCQFSMLSFYQELLDAFVKKNEYYKMLFYETYQNSNVDGSALNLDFVNNIPPKQMTKLHVRLNFLQNLHVLIAVFFLLLMITIIIRIIYSITKANCDKRQDCLSNLKGILRYMEFPVLIRIMLATYIPVMFYGVGQVTNLNFSKPFGMASTIAA